MGQESLNFEEQPRRINRTPNISETISKSEIAQARAVEARLSKEKKYKFLEDVPDFEKKLKKFKLNELINSKKENLFFYDSMRAAMEVRDINDEFGDKTAIYKDASDVYGRKGFFVNISRPFRVEFEDILDSEGNLLPNRGNITDFKHAKEENVSEDLSDLQQAS